MYTTRGKCATFRIFLIWISLIVADLALAAPPQADKITREELLPLLGKPDVTIIDLSKYW